jgi:hypothetical protein
MTGMRNANEIVGTLKTINGPMIVECNAIAPYPGCWHEPNYWVASWDLVIPLYVSGQLQKELCRELRAGPKIKEFIEWITGCPGNYYEDWEILETQKLSPPYNLHNSIINQLQKWGCPPDLLPYFHCDQCGAQSRGHARFLGYRGNGGVGIELTHPVCEECFGKMEWCEDCGDTVMPENGMCPGYDASDEDGRHHHLSDLEDEGEKFGMGPDAGVLEHAEGPPPVVVIWQKGK